jgi:hypothetical protein
MPRLELCTGWLLRRATWVDIMLACLHAFMRRGSVASKEALMTRDDGIITVRIDRKRKTALEVIRLQTGRSMNDLLTYGADLVIAELGGPAVDAATTAIESSRASYRSSPPRGFTKWSSSQENK